MTLSTLQSLVQSFFEHHLPIERNASCNTMLSYRDALRLFLQHAAKRFRRDVDRLDHAALEVDVVRSFLDSLRQDRGCGPRSRNQRLAAIKSFARYVASVAPEHLERCRRIRELSPARCEHREVGYLDEKEVVGLLKACATSLRDRALVMLLYNAGARVQEVVDLDVEDIQLDPVAYVVIVGKGKKQRTCPLWPRTVDALRAWLNESSIRRDRAALFVNARGQRLSRSGVADILRRLATRAKLAPRHAPRVSPHVIRHTTAMHLLQAGVDITTIAAWLGHAQLATTHGYVEINLRMKQAAVSSLSLPLPTRRRTTYPRGRLLAWLERLGARPVMQSSRDRRLTKSAPQEANSA
jgi:site-specific recombinase XerD